MGELRLLLTLHLIFVILILCKATVTNNVSSNKITTQCEFYNATMCNASSSDGAGCTDIEVCEKPSNGKRNHCFVVWKKNEAGNMTIMLKGCFLNNEACHNKTECVERAERPNKNHFFCCCEGNMCNQNFTWDPIPTEPPPVQAIPEQEEQPEMPYYTIIAIVFVSIFIVIILIFGLYIYKKHKSMFNELPTMEPLPLPPPSPYLGLRPIQLIEIKARGRFGAVWKAMYKSDEVAVKIFPVQDKQSWLQEQEIFKLPHMDHPNILKYIGVEKRGDNLQAEFWLITAYHERGSLCDFLKAHTITWTELCKIIETMALGLNHLHEPTSSKTGDYCKPAIAHRDFKSKNVLLKTDLTACIADFGLALVFDAGKSCGDTHGQVGTRRYMAPEVLEGAISFTSDSFLRIDMYACGLVLWELVSRCTAQDGPVPEYRLPFEEEVGQHPTLEDMQEAVVQRKVRPTIPQTWRNHAGLAALCDTMEECWDHDAEARLSASCIMERVMLQKKYQQVPIGLRIENDSPLNTNKENSI